MEALSPEAIAKLAGFSVKAKLIAQGTRAGMHKAKLRGVSVEFAEHKEYSPGDELRHLDWKVLAKADRYYVKQFDQESELKVHLLIDASNSMNYAGKGVSKKEYACTLAAGLCYLLTRQRDNLRLAIFGQDDNSPPLLSPTRAKLDTLYRLLSDCCDSAKGGETSSQASLEKIAESIGRKRSLVLFFSDLMEEDRASLAALRLLKARGHQLVLFHCLHRDELAFPFEGLTIFDALEGGESLLVDPQAIRKLYTERMTAFCQGVESECLRTGISYIQAVSDQEYDKVLAPYLSGGKLAPPVSPGEQG